MLLLKLGLDFPLKSYEEIFSWKHISFSFLSELDLEMSSPQVESKGSPFTQCWLWVGNRRHQEKILEQQFSTFFHCYTPKNLFRPFFLTGPMWYFNRHTVHLLICCVSIYALYRKGTIHSLCPSPTHKMQSSLHQGWCWDSQLVQW